MVSSRNSTKIKEAKFVAINNHLDVEDLVVMLEITPEDLLDRFEDRLLEHREKFIPDGYMIDDQEDVEHEEENNDEGDEYER